MSEQYENNLTIELEAPPLASLIDYLAADALRFNFMIPSDPETIFPGIYLENKENGQATFRLVEFADSDNDQLPPPLGSAPLEGDRLESPPYLPPSESAATAARPSYLLSLDESVAPVCLPSLTLNPDVVAVLKSSFNVRPKSSQVTAANPIRTSNARSRRLNVKPYANPFSRGTPRDPLKARCFMAMPPSTMDQGSMARRPQPLDRQQRVVPLSALAGVGLYKVEVQFEAHPDAEASDSAHLLVDLGSSLTWIAAVDATLQGEQTITSDVVKFGFTPTVDHKPWNNGASTSNSFPYIDGTEIFFELWEGPMSLLADGHSTEGGTWLTADRFVFGLVRKVTGEMAEGNFDGILGLAPSECGERTFAESWPAQIQSLPWHLKDRRYIRQPHFSLSLSHDDLQQSKSVLHFGSMPQALSSQLNLAPWTPWLECPRVDNILATWAGYWRVPLDSITLRRCDDITGESEITIHLGHLTIILDSGSSMSYLPLVECQQIHRTLGATPLNLKAGQNQPVQLVHTLPDWTEWQIRYTFKPRQDGNAPEPPVIMDCSNIEHLVCRPAVDTFRTSYSALQVSKGRMSDIGCLGVTFFTQFAVEFDARPAASMFRLAQRIRHL